MTQRKRRNLRIPFIQVAKSKMFMAALDKTSKNGRLARIVIDEAHCCSQASQVKSSSSQLSPRGSTLGLDVRIPESVPALSHSTL